MVGQRNDDTGPRRNTRVGLGQRGDKCLSRERCPGLPAGRKLRDSSERVATGRIASPAVPGFQLTVGYQFTPFIRGTIGYNFLLISNVVRPGNQIDNTYDGVVHPLVPMTNTSYWTQGINLGLQVSF
jgi:hypothetical protein